MMNLLATVGCLLGMVASFVPFHHWAGGVGLGAMGCVSFVNLILIEHMPKHYPPD